MLQSFPFALMHDRRIHAFSLVSTNPQCRRLRRLIWHGPADFDTTFENSAVLDADAGGLDVADHRAVPFDLNTIPGIHIAADFAGKLRARAQ